MVVHVLTPAPELTAGPQSHSWWWQNASQWVRPAQSWRKLIQVKLFCVNQKAPLQIKVGLTIWVIPRNPRFRKLRAWLRYCGSWLCGRRWQVGRISVSSLLLSVCVSYRCHVLLHSAWFQQISTCWLAEVTSWKSFKSAGFYWNQLLFLINTSELYSLWTINSAERPSAVWVAAVRISIWFRVFVSSLFLTTKTGFTSQTLRFSSPWAQQRHSVVMRKLEKFYLMKCKVATYRNVQKTCYSHSQCEETMMETYLKTLINFEILFSHKC